MENRKEKKKEKGNIFFCPTSIHTKLTLKSFAIVIRLAVKFNHRQLILVKKAQEGFLDSFGIF